MWARYRKWKHTLVFPLGLIALFLLRGEPKESLSLYAGLVLAGLLVLTYLAEEIVWIARRQGRPCPHCGQPVQLRAFRVQLLCPHCRRGLE